MANTKNIEEAVLDTETTTTTETTTVTKTAPPADDLMSRLTAVTEKKDPNAKAAPAWNFTADETDIEDSEDTGNDDFEAAPPKPKAEKKPIEEPVKKAVSSKVKLANARMAVGALNSTQRVIFTPLINRKYKKKFTDEEINKLDASDIIDLPLNKVAEEDLSLRNKFDKLMAKRDQKLKDIPFTANETEDLETMFYNYMEAKEADLPPEIMLFIGLSNVIGKRAIDLCTD